MKKPAMVLFDYGDTLLHESPYDGIAAARAILPYVSEHGKYAPHEIAAHADAIFRTFQIAHRQGFEIHNHRMLALEFESLGLSFTRPIDEIERLQFDAAAPGACVPHAPELLRHLAALGIRTGVISNIGYSGAALSRRLDSLLSENRFEFVIASSEYGIRKPSPLLFQIALQKADVSPSEVWYVGDTWGADVVGANAAGIWPIWFRPDHAAAPDDLPHTRIHDLLELIALLPA